MSNKFSCPECDAETKSFQTLLTHVIYKHDVSPSEASNIILSKKSKMEVKDVNKENRDKMPTVRGKVLD